jgi:hypothetical protein
MDLQEFPQFLQKLGIACARFDEKCLALGAAPLEGAIDNGSEA